MESEDSLKCLHEGRTVLHYNVCVGTDSNNTNILIHITNESLRTPVLRLLIMKCNTKLASFAMWNYGHEPRLAGVDIFIWRTVTYKYECTKVRYTNCKRHRGMGSGIDLSKIKHINKESVRTAL